MRRRRPESFQITKYKRTYNKQTGTFTINISYQTAPAALTQRTKEVAEAFGLGTDQARQFTLYDNVSINVKPNDIVLITGDSGSGKSALLKAIKQDLGSEAQDTKEIPINPDKHIIETLGKNTTEAIEILSKAGLNDAFLFLRTYQELSDGQKHRYQTAQLAASEKQWWILDEFTSTLDRDTAKILAFNLQKTARKMGKAVIAATTHKDLKSDFAPNVHIHKRYGKEVAIRYYPKAKAKECSLTRQMQIEQGTKEDYNLLSQFHYRTHRLPASRKIFALKRKSELCGVVVYSFSSPVCFGRSRVWKGTVKQALSEFSTISRVVVHPKYRSIGLGAKLVAETLGLAGTRCVEAIAVMAKYNPFFEKAGMLRVAESKSSMYVVNAFQELEKLGFDCALMAGTSYNEQKIQQVGVSPILAVLEELSAHDANIRKRVGNLKSIYPKHQEFTQKIQTLNQQELAIALKRLSFTAQTKTYLFWQKQDDLVACEKL